MKWIELDQVLRQDYTITEILYLLEYVDEMGGIDEVYKILNDVNSYKTKIKKESIKECEQYKKEKDLIDKKRCKFEYIIMKLLFMLAGTHKYRMPRILEILPNRKIVLARDIKNDEYNVTLLILHEGYELDYFPKPIRFFDDDGKVTTDALDAISQIITIKTKDGEKYEVNGYAHNKDLV